MLSGKVALNTILALVPFRGRALSKRHCALVRQGPHGGTALSTLYRSIFSLVYTPTLVPIRYVGVFTDGGARDSPQQFGVDNMCAPKLP